MGEKNLRNRVLPFRLALEMPQIGAPLSKFFVHLLSYITFLILFSYMLLTNLSPISEDSPSVLEYIVWAYVFTSTVEEMRQILVQDQPSLRKKFKPWWRSIWNKMDFFISIGMTASIISRYLVQGDDFDKVRIVYSLTLVLCYIRGMEFFYIQQKLGPVIIMIEKMINDLLFFVLVFFVFVISIGVFYNINRYPNMPPGWYLLPSIVYYPYFQIFGDSFLDELNENTNDCTKNETIWRLDPSKRCPEYNMIIGIVSGAYMMVTNVLLVNILIAMFSSTFAKVETKSRQLWHHSRIYLVQTYQDRPTLPPPFIVLNHLLQLFAAFVVWGDCCCEDNLDRVDFKARYRLQKQASVSLNGHSDQKTKDVDTRLKLIEIELRNLNEKIHDSMVHNVFSPNLKQDVLHSKLESIETELQKLETFDGKISRILEFLSQKDVSLNDKE